MNPLQKELCLKLLTGDHYLVKTTNHKRKEIYKLYTGKQLSIRIYKESDFKPFRKIVKKDSSGRMTLNLSSVRKLHGKNYIKKTYKLLNTKL